MVYVALAFGVLISLILFKRLDVVAKVLDVVAATRAAQGVIRSRDLKDDEKEKIVQKAAVSVAGSAVSIFGRVALCLLVPSAAVWLGTKVGAYSAAEVWEAASNWIFIASSSVVMTGALAVTR